MKNHINVVAEAEKYSTTLLINDDEISLFNSSIFQNKITNF